MKYTDEEYVAWVDGMIEQIENESPALDPVADWRMIEILKASIASLLANEATLERHKPKPLMGGSLLPEFQCDDGCGNFPCPTYTGVTDQLDLAHDFDKAQDWDFSTDRDCYEDTDQEE